MCQMSNDAVLTIHPVSSITLHKMYNRLGEIVLNVRQCLCPQQLRNLTILFQNDLHDEETHLIHFIWYLTSESHRLETTSWALLANRRQDHTWSCWYFTRRHAEHDVVDVRHLWSKGAKQAFRTRISYTIQGSAPTMFPDSEHIARGTAIPRALCVPRFKRIESKLGRRLYLRLVCRIIQLTMVMYFRAW